MDKLRHLLPALGALGVLALLALTTRVPAEWPLFGASAAIVVVAVSFFLRPQGEHVPKPVASWIAVALPLAVLCLATGVLLLFLTTSVARQWLLVVTASLIGLSWQSWRRYSWDRERYHPEELENVLLAVELMAVWTLAGAGYRLLLDPSVLPAPFSEAAYLVATITIVIAVALLQRYALWSKRYPRERVWPFMVVTVLLTSELFWVLNFLPHAPMVKSFLVAAVYYTLIMLGRAHFDQTLSRTVVRRYLWFVVGVLTLVLATAQWVV